MRQRVAGRARNRLGFGKPGVVFALARIQAVEQLLQAHQFRALGRGLGDASQGLVDVGLFRAGAAHLHQGDLHAAGMVGCGGHERQFIVSTEQLPLADGWKRVLEMLDDRLAAVVGPGHRDDIETGGVLQQVVTFQVRQRQAGQTAVACRRPRRRPDVPPRATAAS